MIALQWLDIVFFFAAVSSMNLPVHLGHNWGSEHDPDTSECSPSASSGGKYIMFTYSVSGIDSNNKARISFV